MQPKHKKEKARASQRERESAQPVPNPSKHKLCTSKRSPEYLSLALGVPPSAEGEADAVSGAVREGAAALLVRGVQVDVEESVADAHAVSVTERVRAGVALAVEGPVAVVLGVGEAEALREAVALAVLVLEVVDVLLPDAEAEGVEESEGVGVPLGVRGPVAVG